jgi:hypothetical protein
VQTEVASVGVTPASISVQVGQSTTLTAAAYAASGITVSSAVISWTSADPAVASVSAAGLVTGVSAGTTTITATSNGRSGQSLVTVLPAGGGGGGSGDIVVNLASQQQVMTGWEAVAQGGQGTASFPLYRDTLLTLAVNDLGINRLRVPVRSGIEDTLDYFALRGKLPEAQYNCYSYQSVKVPPAAFHFSELDSTIEQLVLPMKQKVEARGEHLYLNLNYTAGISPTKCVGFSYIHTNVAEYAQFALTVFQHVQQKYGIVPDAWEMVLEPDNNTFWTTGSMVGQALAATAAALSAGGYHPAFIAPSTMDASRASTYFDAMVATPGVQGNISELSYHRYANANGTSLAAIGARVAQYRVRSAMLEHIGSDYNDLIADLTQAQVSAWQQFALAYPTGDNGAQYYAVDASNPSRPIVLLGSRTRYLRQFFRYVRFGAVRVDASVSVGGVLPVAFVNANGKAVVVVRAAGAVSFTVQGLPAGTYGMRYTTATATDVAAADQTITSGQLVSASVPAAGVLTIFGR